MNDSGGGLAPGQVAQQFAAARFPSHVEGATMEWAVPYGVIATRLLTFAKNRRTPCRIVGEFLGQEPLADLSPFTFFGLFNGKVRSGERRSACVKLILMRLGVSLPAPHDFQGAPTLNPRHWRFGDVVGGEINERAIETEWACFEAALALADEEEEQPQTRAQFCEAFDGTLKLKGIGDSNLPIALYWARPQRYLALDALMNHHLEAKMSIAVPKELTGERYLELVDEVAERLAADDSVAKTFPDLCVIARREHDHREAL